MGPTIGASWVGTPTMLITRPIRPGPAARTRITCASGGIIPAPRPWSTRKTTRLSIDQASPQAAAPPMNSDSDASHTVRAPNRPTDHPVSGTTAASASR